MSLFGKNSDMKDAASRLSEEAIYEKIAEELQAGERRDGLWIKAYAEANGDETIAKSKYIELRKQSIIDELEIMAHAEKEHARENRKAETLREQNKEAAIQKLKREIKKAESESDWLQFFVIIGYGFALVFSIVGFIGEPGLFILALPLAYFGHSKAKARTLKQIEIDQAKSILTSHGV